MQSQNRWDFAFYNEADDARHLHSNVIWLIAWGWRYKECDARGRDQNGPEINLMSSQDNKVRQYYVKGAKSKARVMLYLRDMTK